MSDKALFVGVDLGEDFTQITYFREQILAPVSICREGDQEQYLIPTELLLRTRDHSWFTADEIPSDDEDFREVNCLFARIAGEMEYTITEDEPAPDVLLAIFFRRVFSVLRQYVPGVKVRYVTVTVPRITRALMTNMEKALGKLGIRHDRYSVISHDEALLSYTIHQRSELWMNDTAVFELDDEGLHYHQLVINRNDHPMSARVEHRDFPDAPKLSERMEHPGETLSGLRHFTALALKHQPVSTVYAVGKGFLDDWADDVLVGLSNGRHVFRGQNLFAKGACYQARMAFTGNHESVLFFDEDKCTSGVSITAFRNGQDEEITLIRPGTIWYEAKAELDLILDEEDELTFQIKDFGSKKVWQRFLSLNGVAGRPRRMTRVHVEVFFTSVSNLIIRAKDMGFGEFQPTSNRIWELSVGEG